MTKQRKKELVQTVLFLVVAALLFFLMPRFVAERIIVEGESMAGTLHDKDNIIIEKVSRYFGDIDRYDVIVFFPSNEAKKIGTRFYVKRVIGLPGETVQIQYNTVYINGKPLPETYGTSELDNPGIAAEPITLGENEYFVLGDNRHISEDSRSSRIGVIPLERIGGKVVFRIYPFRDFGKVE